MIKSFKATTASGDNLTFELSKPENTGVLVRRIDGLGPVKADISSTGYALLDGVRFSGARKGARNIVLDLELLSSRPVEQNRIRLYDIFPVKETITFEITNDSGTFTTEGYVESFEPDIFSERESIQVSILCPDPYFYGAEDRGVVLNFDEGYSKFEFPLINDSLTSNLIILGDNVRLKSKEFRYNGTSDTGIDVTANFGKSVNVFWIETQARGNVEKMVFNFRKLPNVGVRPGDILWLNTNRGKKRAWLRRPSENKTYNVLGAFDVTGRWLRVKPGVNRIGYGSDINTDSLSVKVSVKRRYAGV